jgi:tripartite-type tricarboxylate transporter receptor subunit TctC
LDLGEETMLAKTRAMRLIAGLALLLPLCGSALAQQAYPTGVVKIIVPYAAGGAVDPMARLMADRLSRALGQNFVVENRPGAGGNIGIEAAIRSAHDGYTLLATPAGIAINPALFAKVPYDLERDLVPVGLVNRVPMVVLASPSLGVKSLHELIARVKAKPGAINYAISGNGTLDHLVCEHLRALAGLDMVKVTYQGVPKGMTALLAGEVQMMVVAMNAALPYIQAGQVTALAVTSAQRSPVAPSIPTMAEAGIDNFVMYGWSMLFAPTGVPQDIVVKLNSEITKAVAQPEVRKIISDLGAESPALGLPELKNFVHDNAALFAKIVRASGVKID